MNKFSYFIGAVLLVSACVPGLAYADDTTPPVISGGRPEGNLPSSATTATILVNTDEIAVCKYGTSGASYSSLPSYFSNTSGTLHMKDVSVSAGTSYDYFVRCIDESGNANQGDYLIYFSVARNVADATPPVINGSGAGGTYAAGTKELSFAISTDENATCRYANSSMGWSAMSGRFSVTGGLNHTGLLQNLKDGDSVTLYTRCQDAAQNANSTDTSFTFTIATSSIPTASAVPTVGQISQRVVAAQLKFIALLKNTASADFRSGLIALLNDLVAIQNDLKLITNR